MSFFEPDGKSLNEMHVQRLKEIIDKASFDERMNSKKLAEYLIKQGVCDKDEVKRLVQKAELDGTIDYMLFSKLRS